MANAAPLSWRAHNDLSLLRAQREIAELKAELSRSRGKETWWEDRCHHMREVTGIDFNGHTAEQAAAIEAATFKLEYARKRATEYLADANYVENCLRATAWNDTPKIWPNGTVSPHGHAVIIKESGRVVYPEGWPPGMDEGIAANRHAGLTDDGLALRPVEGEPALPAAEEPLGELRQWWAKAQGLT